VPIFELLVKHYTVKHLEMSTKNPYAEIGKIFYPSGFITIESWAAVLWQYSLAV
jgi:hypothetical protein